MIRLLATLLCLLAPALATAEVYTYIDSQGNRVFTDQPHANAKRVPLAPSNRMAANPGAVKVLKPQTPLPSAKPPPSVPYQLLRILVPEPDAEVRSSPGELIVSVTSEPGLQPGHSYRLLLDGKPTGEPGISPVFALASIDRGRHQLAVEILDSAGRIVERTPSQVFQMLRISLAQKRQAHPCAKTDYGVRPECPLADKPKEEKSSFLPFL